MKSGFKAAVEKVRCGERDVVVTETIVDDEREDLLQETVLPCRFSSADVASS